MTLTEQQAKEAIGRIDQVLSQVTLDRKSHAQLARDVQAIQEHLYRAYKLEELLAKLEAEASDQLTAKKDEEPDV